MDGLGKNRFFPMRMDQVGNYDFGEHPPFTVTLMNGFNRLKKYLSEKAFSKKTKVI